VMLIWPEVPLQGFEGELYYTLPPVPHTDD
jgi:hypothetical protein